MNRDRLKTNYILNTLYQILLLLVPIITTPYISRILGANNVGIYSYTYSIVSYFVLMATTGTTTFGHRAVAYVQNDDYKRSVTFWEIVIIRGICTIICFIIYILYLQFLKEHLVISGIQGLYLISVVFDITWFFQALEEFKKIVFRNILVKLSGIIAVFIFVNTEDDLWIYVLILALTTFVGNLLIWYYLPRYLTKIHINDLDVTSNIKDILLLFIPTIAIQVYTVLDKIMLGNYTSNGVENGYYEQAEKVVRMALAIITSLGTVMIPRISLLFSEKRYDLIHKYINFSYRFTFMISIPIMFGIIGVSKSFVPVFFGQGYDKICLLLPIYSCIILFVSVSNVTGCQFLIPAKRQNIYTIAVTISAVLNFLLNIFLIPLYFSVGAAIASVIAEFIGSAFMLVYIQYKRLITVKEVIIDSKNYWIAALIMFGLELLLSELLKVSVTNLLIEILGGIILYCLIVIILKDSLFLELYNNFVRRIKNENKINNF